MPHRINQLFNIQYPIIQGGMVWCSGWELASAVSNAGGLGLIGTGSMDPITLRQQISKTKKHTSKPFGVNIPLLKKEVDKLIDVVIEEKIKIVFTSAGNPTQWTQELKRHGITVVHVVSSLKFALKAQDAGVDAIVAEGVEAGGHNGREETSTFVLIPLIKKHIKIPLIAAGGIASGAAMLAAMSLGADGLQIGTLFASCSESSASKNYKEKLVEIKEGQTRLTLKKIAPIRIIANSLYEKIRSAESEGASPEELKEIIGMKNEKKGIFEGMVNEAIMSAGQSSVFIHKIETADTIMERLIEEYNIALQNLQNEFTCL